MSSHSAMVASPVRQFARERRLGNFVRPLERVLSLLLLVTMAPLLLINGILIFALCGRSPLVAHLRIGQFGAPFWTMKLRTMWTGWSLRFAFIEYIVDDSGPQYKNSGHPRLPNRFPRVFPPVSHD